MSTKERGPKIKAYWTDDHGRYWQLLQKRDMYLLRHQGETEDGIEWMTQGHWFDSDYTAA